MRLLFLGLVLLLVNGDFSLEADVNERPIIGILSEEIPELLRDLYPEENYHSYIVASYVKFVEGSGARPVPIWIGKTKDYYKNIMNKINGVLFPGGELWFNATQGYSEAGGYIYDLAKELNKNGDYFPLWGTCLGFELLAYLSANRTEIRADCNSNKQSLPLEFKPDFKSSKMFGGIPANLEEILSINPVTANFHHFCVTETNLTKFKLDKEWRVNSLNNDTAGLTFISSMEHREFPFYGVQFHPEKNLYVWVPSKNISHSENATIMSQYFANFFVNEARKSLHHFANYSDELNHLIYNFPETFGVHNGSLYVQSYMFKEDVDYPGNSATMTTGSFFYFPIAFIVSAFLIMLG